jgi:hypothetical protein
MDPTAPLAPQAWENFYVIVGSTAGALIGLQFVVLTLISEASMVAGSGEAITAFGSPNVVHFCAALLVCAIFSAPWQGLGPPGVAIAVAGVCGFIYSVVVLRRAMRQRDYKPVLEDWIWHAVLPMAAYAALVHAGIRLARVPGDTLYVVGGSALLLVFIGIHNAWDTVTYITLERARQRKASAAATRAPAAHFAPGSAPESGQHGGRPGPEHRPEHPGPPTARKP